MRKFLEHYTVTLISLAATFLLEVVANFVLQLDKPFQFVVIAVGVMASLVVLAIEREVPEMFKSLLSEQIGELKKQIEELKGGLDLYRSLLNIDDKVLQGAVFELVRDFSKGKIPPHLAELRARTLITQVSRTIWGSDCRADAEAFIEWWSIGTGKNWYKDNLSALSRKVSIERHFLFSKRDVVRPDGAWHPGIEKLVREQASAGIDVRILWTEELKQGKMVGHDLQKDFVILDEQEVSVSIGDETWIYRHPSNEVQEYIKIFQEQRMLSYRLEEILPASMQHEGGQVGIEQRD